MKNRTSLILATVIMIPIIIGVCLLSIRGAEKNEGTVGISVFGSAELRNVIELPVSEVSNLEVIYTSKNLYVYPAEGDQIVIKEYLISDHEEAKAQVTKEPGETGKQNVTVTGGKRNTFTFFFIGVGEKIEIYLPKEGMEALGLQTGSGNISKEGTFSWKADALTVTAGSGNVKWEKTEANMIEIQTGSGNITTKEMTGGMNLTAGSGNIKVENASGNLGVQTGSGNISVKEFAGACSAQAGSGNVKVEADQVTGDFAMKTKSGNIGLELPENLSFNVVVQTGSGNIGTSFDDALSYNKKGNQASGTVGSAPTCTINAEAGSGNVKITMD